MSEVPHQDPLVALVVDAHKVDRATLASALGSWARIDTRENLIRFMPGAREKATIKQRILVALLGQMAIKLLNDEHEEGLKPTELEKWTGAKGSSLRPQLKVLADGGVVSKNRAGGYVVPPEAFDLAVATLGDNDG